MTVVDNTSIEQHEIAIAIDRFLHRVQDTRQAASMFMPNAQRSLAANLHAIQAELDRLEPLLKSSDPTIRVLASRDVHKVLLRFHRARNSQVADVVERGLFLTLFAAFDAFTGDLMRAIFARQPALFQSLSHDVSFTEILAAESLDDIKKGVLERDVETLRRKSYVEQFATLGSRFGLVLTKFASWPLFVEASQRRNVLTHCDGVVTAQYREKCIEAGLPVADVAAVGARLRLGAKYFLPTAEVVLEVGFKLGQTLWRKTVPDEHELAEFHLRETLYRSLEHGQWKRARMIGEFGMAQPRFTSDLNRRIILLNYAQALQRVGESAKASALLGELDWSATTAMFQLAVAVLRKQYDVAASLMRTIGPADEYLSEQAYHTFPIFLEFRESDEFAAAYFAVFGRPYSEKVSEAASEASAEVQEATGEQDEIAEQSDAAGAVEEMETVPDAVEGDATAGTPGGPTE